MSSSDSDLNALQNEQEIGDNEKVSNEPLCTAASSKSRLSIEELLDQLPNGILKESLEQIILDKENELTHSKYCCDQAKKEALETKERLSQLELELNNICSAAALFVADQDDAMSLMKRKYDEEIASILELTRQGLLNDPIEEPHKSDRSSPVYKPLSSNMCVSNGQAHTVPTAQTNEKITPQSLANHALDKVEKVVKRVGFKSLVNLNKLNLSNLTGSNLTADGKERLEQIMETYKMEINKLKQILDNSCDQANEPCSQNGSPEKKLSDQRTTKSTNDSCNFRETTSDYSKHETNCTLNSNNLSLTGDVSETLTEVTTEVKSLETQETINVTEFEDLKKQYDQVLDDLQSKSIALQLALERQTELENELKIQTTKTSKQIEQLETQSEQMLRRLEDYLSNYKLYRNATEKEIQQLRSERKASQNDLDVLRSHYDALVGRRSVAAAELSAQPIHLPFDKSDLELLALKLYEENISLREAREHLDDRLRSETQFHRQQLLAEQQERLTLESTLQQELTDARKSLANYTSTSTLLEDETNLRQKFEEEAKQTKLKLQELQDKYELLESEANEHKVRSSALQQQVIRLQTDLDNVESVQADFVKLSQSLQVQLERFRQQDNEVRWINPEDVTQCFACNSTFPTGPLTSSRKINCKHCGKVHCTNCMKHTVPSGPLGSAATVCDICHTLLNKNAAPYFSTNELNNINNNNNQRKQSTSPKRFSFTTSSVITYNNTANNTNANNLVAKQT